MAVAAPRRAWHVPVDLGVGLVSMFAGACVVGWALMQPTIGGAIAAGCGAMMVLVGGVWTRKALTG